MSASKFSNAIRQLIVVSAACGFISIAAPSARAAFHLWALNEIYSNASGTLQFIEMSTTFGSQQFVGGQQISAINSGGSPTNTFTIPSNLPGDSSNRSFLIGTAGIQAAGGPAPDFIMPNGFLFTGGGTLNFFGTNSGPYTALPLDGLNSRTWGGGNALNTPTNFAGAVGQVNGVPEPSTILLSSSAVGLYGLIRRRSRLWAAEPPSCAQ